MATILYTTTEAVRAKLGVSIKDLTDTEITAFGAETHLRAELYTWLPTHATVYANGTAGGATADQVQRKDLLVLYSQTFLALKLATPASLFALQKIADGGVEGQRFREGLVRLQDQLAAELQDLKDDLLADLDETPAAATLFAKVTPAYDPVIGS